MIKYICPRCSKAGLAEGVNRPSVRFGVKRRRAANSDLVVLNGATLTRNKGLAPHVVCPCGFHIVIFKGSAR